MGNSLGNNLKMLRKSKGANQSEVATVLQKASTTIGNWEKGISEPNISELKVLSQYFGVSVDDLLSDTLSNTHLSENKKGGKKRHLTHLNAHGNTHPLVLLAGQGEGSKHILNEPKTPYNVPRIPAVVTVDQSGIDNIVYVPVKAQAGYLVGHGDQEFIANLPSLRMPGLNNGTYRMFEVSGLSMSPTLSDRDRVICQWVPSIAEIRENRVHVVVLKEGVMIKRVVNRTNERGVVYLKSDTLTHRADYPIKEVDPADILEIWYVLMKVSSDLSDPSEIHRKMSDMEVNMHEIMKKLGMLRQ